MTQTKKSILIPLVVLFVLSLSAAVFAASMPGVTFVSPSYPDYSYMLQGNSFVYAADVTNSPTSVTMTYSGDTYKSLGSMSLYSGITYRKTWTPSSSDWVKPINTGGTWYFPGLFVDGTNSAGTGGAQRLHCKTAAGISTYQNTENGFTYSSPTSNSFRAVGTGQQSVAHNTPNTYNCLAYAVGITDHWEWPWSGTPTNAQLDSYMSGKGFSTASSSVLPYTKVIYYSGDHFSKVTAWSSDGTPTKVMSKWGYAEVVESNGYNTFQGKYYGSASRFYK